MAYWPLNDFCWGFPISNIVVTIFLVQVMTDITMLKHIPSNSAVSGKIVIPAAGLKLPK